MVFCNQNGDFSTRIASLCGSQPSFVAFACKTATLGPELQVSMGPRPHPFLFSIKTAPLAAEVQVSIGPSPHLWFLQANSDFWFRITSLYRSQTLPVDL